MKKRNFIAIYALFLYSNCLFSQGWIGSANNLYPVNTNLGLTPLNVGIGTNNPLAQFHTTGSIRFAGITNDNTHSRVLVQNNSGDLYWRDAATLGSNNAWLLNGNTGTNSTTNFIGTIDNQGLKIRTSNINRITLDPGTIYGTNNIGYVFVSEYSNINTNPGQLAIYGKDIPGFTMPFAIYNTRDGQTWSFNAGPNNTMGRLVRYCQFFSNTTQANHFYDLGIGQDSCFFITQRGVSGTGGFFPMRMITISPANRVGLNMGWAQSPTANLHSVGTVRLENLPSGTGNILVIDAQGNVFRSSSTVLRTAKDELMQQELNEAKQTIKNLQNSIEALRKEIEKLKGQLTFESQPYLRQNFPNPSNSNTTIEYFIPESIKGKVLVYDAGGKLVKVFENLPGGNNSINLDISQYQSGTYFYSLLANGKTIDHKTMIVQ